VCHTRNPARVALHSPQRRTVRGPPEAYLTGRRPNGEQGAIVAQGDLAREIEGVSQHGRSEVGAHETGVLRVNVRQVSGAGVLAYFREF
jgi:hypothetical protein